MESVISDSYAKFAHGEGEVLFPFPPTQQFQSVVSDWPCCHCWSFSPCLTYAETVDQQRRTMSLRTKEKVNNAKSLAFLSSFFFFFFVLDRAADRPVSNTEPNYLPRVKENVSFGCSGFSRCNKSQPWDPGFIWFNKDFKERKSFPCFYWEGLVISVCFIWGPWLVWPTHIKSHSEYFWA